MLLLRRNCCERHGCEEDRCEGTVENGLRRTGCCEEDHCEWTLLHVAHLLYSCCEGTAAKSMAAKRTAAKERLRTDCGEGNAAKETLRTDYGERAAAKGTTENGLLRRGLRRMDCCEEDYGEWATAKRTAENGLLRRGLRRNRLLTTDGCERTLLHVAHLPYTLLRNGSMCTRKTPGLPGRSHGKHKTV